MLLWCARDIFQRVDDYYSIEETSKILKRSVSTIRKYINAGELEAVEQDGKRFVLKAAVHGRKEALERGAREIPSQSAEDALQAIERLSVALGRERAMKELTGDSRASLEAERDRLREVLDEERERRIRAEAEVAFLKARPKSWAARLFGL